MPYPDQCGHAYLVGVVPRAFGVHLEGVCSGLTRTVSVRQLRIIATSVFERGGRMRCRKWITDFRRNRSVHDLSRRKRNVLGVRDLTHHRLLLPQLLLLLLLLACSGCRRLPISYRTALAHDRRGMTGEMNQPLMLLMVLLQENRWTRRRCGNCTMVYCSCIQMERNVVVVVVVVVVVAVAPVVVVVGWTSGDQTEAHLLRCRCTSVRSLCSAASYCRPSGSGSGPRRWNQTW